MADTRVTLRPDSTNQNSNWGAINSASLHAATSDNSDSSYVEAQADGALAKLGLGNLALPAGAVIRQVRIRTRYKGNTDQDPNKVRHRTALIAPETANPYREWTDVGDSITSFQERIGPWWTSVSNVFGGSWTDSIVDAMLLQIRPGNTVIGGGEPTHAELYVDVEYNERPVGTLTAPTGTVNNSAPVAEWTYSDPNSDPQTHFQIVIESGNHTADASPDLANNEYDSGEVASSGTTHQLPALAEGTYTAWVRVRQANVSGQELRSVWNNELFTVDVLPPGVPTLTATADNTNKRVELTADSNSPPEQPAEKYWIEYSDDGGTTWEAVRGGNPITVNPLDGDETIYDYESPPNAARQYRARASRTDAGNEAYSDWSTTQSATVTYGDEWWLKDILDSSNSMTIEVESDPWDIEHPADIAVFNPLGRRYPVVVREATVKAARFTLQVPTIDAATYDSLVTLWESGHPMLLIVPGIDKQYYVQFNSPRGEQLRNLNDPYRGNTLQFVEIERPSV